jgi:diguanylate cyclase (GGDEF)-like protein
LKVPGWIGKGGEQSEVPAAKRRRAPGRAKKTVTKSVTRKTRRARPADDQIALLNRIARAATLDLDLGSTLQRITDAIAHHSGWEFVACALVDISRSTYVCRALTTELDTAIHVGHERPLGSGIVGKVAQTRRAVLVDDVRRSRTYVSTAPAIRSELCVPIVHGGELVALLDVESTKVGAFHDAMPLMKTVADQIAGLVANAHLYEEAKRRARLLEMLSELSRLALDASDLGIMLDRVVAFVHEQFGLTASAILLLNEAGDRFELAAAAGETMRNAMISTSWPLVGVVGRAITSGATQFVPDVNEDSDYIVVNGNVRAEYAIPIRYREKVLGALNLEAVDPGLFTDENRRSMELLAAQVAGGIHLARVNRRLAETNKLVEERTRELELVNTQLQLANEVLQRLSLHDGLTGVANRRRFEEVLATEWRRASRSGESISLAMIDIDTFKAFNDTYGHQAGDDCLKEVAYTLDDSIQRAGDLLARYGGEEFAVILPGSDIQQAAAFAEILKKRVEERRIRHERSTVSPFLTISIGVASTSFASEGRAVDLVAAADRALYKAKANGKNRVEISEVG